MRDRDPRTERHHATALDLPGVDGGLRQVQPHLSALLALGRNDEDPIPDDDQFLHGGLLAEGGKPRPV